MCNNVEDNTQHTELDTKEKFKCECWGLFFLGVPTKSGGHAEAEQQQVRCRGETAVLRQDEELINRDGLRRREPEVMNS